MNILPAFSSSETATLERVPQQVLDQDDFLKLLVAQMRTQDPLSPQKDIDFIAQMAQFSALEQSRTMQSDIARLRNDQHFLHAAALLGQTVELHVDGGTRQGTVNSVQIEAGTPRLVVDGVQYALSQVLTVTPPSFFA
jgi:flagellar basal-body rod modification protein FlgD